MSINYALFGIISGIIAADLQSGRFFFIAIACTMALFIIISLISRRFFTPLLILSVFMFAGYLSGTHAIHSDNSMLKNYSGSEVVVSGKITELPTKGNGNFAYTVNAMQISYDDKIYHVNEKLRVTTESEFKYGDVIDAKGEIKEIPENSNEFGFNSKVYYKSRGISYKMYSEECTKRDLKLKDYNLYSLTTYICSGIYETINKSYSGDDAALLSAIAVGNKSDFSDGFDKLLQRTGVKRCVYPAFLQIMLFMSFMTLLQTRVPQKLRFAALTVFLLIFGVTNSTNPIFIKTAFYIAILNFSRQIFGFSLKQDALFIVVIAMLLSNPLLLYDGGFVSSVVANVLIIFFMPIVYKKLKFLHFNYLKSSVAISLICTVGLLPLSAYYFNGIAIYQILATLILLPVTAIIFMLSPIWVLLLKLFGSAPIVSNIISSILYIYKGVPYWIDKLPSPYITLGVPNIATILGFYMIIYAIYLFIDKRKFYFPLALGCTLFIAVFITQSIRIFTAEVTFINVGQGDAALISVPYRCNIIVDGGGGYDFTEKTDEKTNAREYEYNIGEEIFVPYLQTHGNTKIDAAFVSHYHKDHVEGTLAAIELLNVKTVYMPDLLPENEWRIKIEKAAKARGTDIEYISRDTTLHLGNGFIVDAIYPTKTALLSGDENNTTVVYKMHYGKTSILFTGDITSLYEASLVYQRKNIDCDILKVAHHGSAYSTCSEFVKATSPQYAVICLGEGNPYGFPREEVLKNLKGIPIYRTDTNGDIRFSINRDGIKSIYTLK